MMSGAQSLYVLQHQPWIWIPPGLAISLTVMSTFFIADGIRDALDPRTK
jgi:peptide/nickel transport system permease protein